MTIYFRDTTLQPKKVTAMTKPIRAVFSLVCSLMFLPATSRLALATEWLLVVPVPCNPAALQPELRDCSGPCMCGGQPNDPYKYWLVSKVFQSRHECLAGLKILHGKIDAFHAKIKDADPFEQMQLAETPDFSHALMDGLSECITGKQFTSGSAPSPDD